MALWIIKETELGHSVYKDAVTEQSVDFGDYEKTLDGILIAISELLKPGDLVQTPQGIWSVPGDKNFFTTNN